MEWTASPVIILTFPSGIKNPVLVANRLLSEAQKGKLSAGRIPPWWLSLWIHVVLMWLYPLVNVFSFVSFLVGRGAHDWAVSHGIPPCPSEKMATSEFRYTDSEICFIQEMYFLLRNYWTKTLLRTRAWRCINYLGGWVRLRLFFFFHTQSSVYLRTRGTSERWRWQKRWTQDIIRQRKDDNQVKMWVQKTVILLASCVFLLNQLSQNGPSPFCCFCSSVPHSERHVFYLPHRYCKGLICPGLPFVLKKMLCGSGQLIASNNQYPHVERNYTCLEVVLKCGPINYIYFTAQMLIKARSTEKTCHCV